MRRKLIKQGVDAITVTLPAKWVRDNGLKGGDEIDIKEKEGDLSVSNLNKIKEKTSKANVGARRKQDLMGSDSFAVSSMYSRGYTRMELSYGDNIPSYDYMHKMISSFTGLEIIEKNKEGYLIKSFIQEDPNEIDKLIIKVFQVLNEQLLLIDQTWENNTYTTSIYDDIHRIMHYIKRVVNVKKYPEERSHEYFSFANAIIEFAYYLLYCARDISSHNLPKSKLFSLLIEEFNQNYQIFIKKEFSTACLSWVHTGNDLRKLFSEKNLSSTIKKENEIFFMHFYLLIMKSREITRKLVGFLVPIESELE